MGVVNYYSVGGVLQGEQAMSAGVVNSRVDYLTDALGSVTATIDQAGGAGGTLQNTYQYKPYGQMLAKTGTAPDPKFTWVGSQGYRRTGRKYSDVYVRARQYESVNGRWTTKNRFEDLLNGEFTYCYTMANPVTSIDPTGYYPQVICPSDPVHEKDLQNAVNKVCTSLNAAGRQGLDNTKCLNQPNQSQCMVDWCNHTKSTVRCGNIETCKSEGACAYSHSKDKGAGNPVFICPISWTLPDCKKWPCSTLVGDILHEVAGLCGSPHTGGGIIGFNGILYTDPCDLRTNCLSSSIPGLV